MTDLHAVSPMEAHLIEDHGIHPLMIATVYREPPTIVDEVAVASHDFMHSSGLADHVHLDEADEEGDTELYQGA